MAHHCDEPLTEEWLAKVGFCWHQLDRQPQRHWLMWLDTERRWANEVGLELASGAIGGEWFCWLRSDTAHRYSRFVHVRHIKTRGELIRLVEGLTGRDWRPEDHLYGRAMTPKRAARERAEDERLDRRMMREHPAWREIEKDDTRGGALPEHLQREYTQEAFAADVADWRRSRGIE